MLFARQIRYYKIEGIYPELEKYDDVPTPIAPIKVEGETGIDIDEKIIRDKQRLEKTMFEQTEGAVSSPTPQLNEFAITIKNEQDFCKTIKWLRQNRISFIISY